MPSGEHAWHTQTSVESGDCQCGLIMNTGLGDLGDCCNHVPYKTSARRGVRRLCNGARCAPNDYRLIAGTTGATGLKGFEQAKAF